jgi:hypothetical protein
LSNLQSRPNGHISAQAPSSASGTVTLGMMVAQKLRRKTKIFQLLAEEQVRFRSDFERPAHHASQL